MNGKWLYIQFWPGRCQNVDLINHINSMYHNIIWDSVWNLTACTQKVTTQSTLTPTLATIPSFTALSFHTWRVILTPSSRGHYWWRFFIDGLFVFRSAHSGSLSNPLSVSNTKQMSQETAWFQPCINYASSCSVFEKRLKQSS